MVARGAAGGSFFQCRQEKEVVVVWETRTRETVVHVRRPIADQPSSFTEAAAPLSPGSDSWNIYTCTITPDGMGYVVNGNRVLTKKDYKNDVSRSRTFQLEPKGQQMLEVKSFTVKPLQP